MRVLPNRVKRGYGVNYTFNNNRNNRFIDNQFWS